jgi:HAD superfamily hydrolase (TIGR01484 family)
MLPAASIPVQDLSRLKFIMSDIDDTLTLQGQLPAVAFAALERLQKSGLKIILVTGRPAGWCDLIARLWPVDAVVGENGAFYFRYDHISKKMHRIYAQSEKIRVENLNRLQEISRDVLRKFPGTAIASDQAFREIDIAIDFAEDVVPLPLSVAQKIAAEFMACGAVAKVSSIHVNAWFGNHDKLTMSLRCLREVFEIKSETLNEEVAYLGDSPNDAPMFAHFSNSIGVANIAPLTSLMDHLPRYITRGEGGHGFAEFADLVLGAR